MSKALIVLIVGMLAVGCGEVENGAYKHRPKQNDTNESTPTTNTNEVNGTTAKPVKELTLEEKVVGTYEGKEDGDTGKFVFLANGVLETYLNGKKEEDGKWKIVERDIHVSARGGIAVIRVNKDGSLTMIARIDALGKREEAPKEKQVTLKRIK